MPALGGKQTLQALLCKLAEVEWRMTNFEFVFSLLVILLGLGLAEVFGGLARVVKERPRVQLGWATGLLATWTITRTVLSGG